MVKARARRRMDRERMVSRAARMWAEWRRPFGDQPRKTIAHEAQKWADNMKRCSCWACCNGRRQERGPSMSEVRRIQSIDSSY
jgi:hypothetical protein